MKGIRIAIILFLAGALSLQAQEVQKTKFNPNYSIQDISAQIGVISTTHYDELDGEFLQLTYTRLFWKHFAYKVGCVAVPQSGGYENLVGMPLAISLRPGTVSFEDAAANAVMGAINDTMWDGLFGNTERIGGDIVTNLLLMLFRRWDFYVGITPAYYLGAPSEDPSIVANSRFALFGDAGVVLSIPIWRFSLDINPAFHYSFTNNFEVDGTPSRVRFSASAGISWLF